MNDVPTYAVSLTIGLAFLISLATLFRLFQKHIDGRPLLEYQPRRPAPWNFLAPLVMLAPLLLALSSALTTTSELDAQSSVASGMNAVVLSAAGSPPATVFSAASLSAATADLPDHTASAETLASRLWLQAAMTVAMALIAYVLLTVVFGATPQDLGLPLDARQLGRDVKIGATAWAASVAPIYFLMYVLTSLFEPESGHPLIEELVTDHSLSMMAAAAFAAVIAAPLYEETAFRLVFQGWLERRDMISNPVITEELPTLNSAMPLPYATEAADPAVSEQTDEQPAAHVTYSYSSPGWIPIIISSMLFGLAHYGHGVSPAPLILLGMVMGYLYQRTHRVTPSIVCHLLFNAFTFILLTLQFFGATE